MITEQLATPSQTSEEAALANLLEQMADELKTSGSVDLASWQERYPKFASEIQRLSPTLEALVDFSSAGGVDSAVDQEDSFRDKMLGDFRIVRELGRGGMGIVYEAEQLSLNRRVALKILPTAAVLDPRTLQRFKNEAQAAAALDHPHIVDVYGIGSERCVHYYAMRLIDGCTLADIIAELGNREGATPAEPRVVAELRQRVVGDRLRARDGCRVAVTPPWIADVTGDEDVVRKRRVAAVAADAEADVSTDVIGLPEVVENVAGQRPHVGVAAVDDRLPGVSRDTLNRRCARVPGVEAEIESDGDRLRR
jgi:hypothetical protein